jgi:hypothetical protein
MPQESEPIEVEVVAIDGAAPATSKDPQTPSPKPSSGPLHSWQKWQRRLSFLAKLSPRWWPLWTLLGIIASILLLAVGLVIGVLYLIYYLLKSIARALFR